MSGVEGEGENRNKNGEKGMEAGEGRTTKMLGKDVKLKQAREGVGDVMCGKRRRERKPLKGKRRGGGEVKRDEKKRVKSEMEQARFMEIWAMPNARRANADNEVQGNKAGKF